jgi:hypothetical protein
MTGKEFAESLGGKPRRGWRGGIYDIADWSLAQIREKAGSDGELQRPRGDLVQILFKLSDCDVLLVGSAESDNRLTDAMLVFDRQIGT